MQKILEIRVGSHLYGTNTATSDEDYSGVFIPEEDYVFGLLTVKEINESIVDKLANGKNSPDAVDKKYIELRRFMHLAMDNNPNIIEQLFVNPKNILFVNDYGRILLENKHIFLYKGLFEKFIGYAIGQKRKMIIRPDNYINIMQGIEYLSTLQDGDMYLFKINELPDKSNSIVFTRDYVKIGDMNFVFTTKVSTALTKLNKRIETSTYRTKMYDEVGYDTKFASHLIRLLYEGKELLETGDLQFPLKTADLILDIKNNKYSMNEVIEMSDVLENELRDSKEKSSLPSNPNFKVVNELCKHIMKDFYRNELTF